MITQVLIALLVGGGIAFALTKLTGLVKSKLAQLKEMDNTICLQQIRLDRIDREIETLTTNLHDFFSEFQAHTKDADTNYSKLEYGYWRLMDRVESLEAQKKRK